MTTALLASPIGLVDMADAVLHDRLSEWGGSWARAVALLARQGLERALDELWTVRGVELSPVSTHAQLLCLRAYLIDDALAADVRYAWGALSRACHHHPYELARRPRSGPVGWSWSAACQSNPNSGGLPVKKALRDSRIRPSDARSRNLLHGVSRRAVNI